VGLGRKKMKGGDREGDIVFKELLFLGGW